MALYDGMTARFRTVTTGGVGTVTYNWKKDGVSQDAENLSNLVVLSATYADEGTYHCTVSDGVTTLDSVAVARVA